MVWTPVGSRKQSSIHIITWLTRKQRTVLKCMIEPRHTHTHTRTLTDTISLCTWLPGPMERTWICAYANIRDLASGKSVNDEGAIKEASLVYNLQILRVIVVHA